MPAQVYTDKMFHYMQQRMRAIAESKELMTATLNGLNPAQIAAHVALINNMKNSVQAAVDNLDATYESLKQAELTRLNAEIAELEEFITRLQLVNT